MRNQEVVTKFKESLKNGDEFKIVEINENVWKVQSSACVITFLFERHDDKYIIEIQEPVLSPGAEPMHILLLRFLRSAHNQDVEENTPVYYAWLMNNYFSDLLAGDFSIRKEYEQVYNDFFDKFFNTRNLPEDDPIKIKIKNYDISWMQDMK